MKTNSRKEEVRVVKNGLIEISLKEKPERNMANKKLVTVISRYLSLPVGNIKIINGHTRPLKIVLVSGMKDE